MPLALELSCGGGIAPKRLIDYLLCVTPTHKDGLSEEDAARVLQDTHREHSLIDLPVLVPKATGLAAALFLALLSASPKVPALGSDTGFVIPAAIALTASMAWAAWFETLIHRRLALGCIWVVLLTVIAGIILHIPDPTTPAPLGMPAGVAALVMSIAFTWLLLSKGIIYPKLDFFVPATAVLCLAAVLTVL